MPILHRNSYLHHINMTTDNSRRKTLGYFKGLGADLDSVPEIAIKLGETVAKIALLVGI